MAFIEIIDYSDSSGKLREIYDELIKTRGKLAEVHKIQSLHPETILTHMNLYLSIMFSQSPLNRAQREMMAVIVSISNKCQYGISHHREALNYYWNDDTRIFNLCQEYQMCKNQYLELRPLHMDKMETFSGNVSLFHPQD